MYAFKGEISDQLSLQRIRSGFQLIDCDTADGISLKSVNELPFNFYITTKDSIMRFMNELDAMTFGYSSVKSAIGKKLFDNISSETATIIINNNDWVMKSNKMLITEEIAEGKNYYNRCLSIKHPLYVNNEIIGILGCSIHFDRDSLVQSLCQIVNAGLLNSYSANYINHFLKRCPYNLSKREKECLYYCVKGKPAREIATILNLCEEQ